jgi:hypothetical protein
MRPNKKPLVNFHLTYWADGTYTLGFEDLSYQCGWGYLHKCQRPEDLIDTIKRQAEECQRHHDEDEG